MTAATFDGELLAKIEASGVLAVLVVDEPEQAAPLAAALLDGGVAAMELTLRTPAALEALRIVRRTTPEMIAGVGTVLTSEQVGQVVEADAAFAVAPGTNPAVLREARRRGLSFAPGVATPSDVEAALAEGCRMLKFFPAEPSGGLDYLRSMAAPFVHLGVRFVPLGGIGPTNAADYLADPLILAVGGSWLAPRSLIAAGDWDEVRARAQQACELVRSARSGGAIA